MSAIGTGPVDALATVEPFDRIPEDVLVTLVDDVVWRALAPGEVLVEAGTQTREVAVVVEGQLRVELPGDDGTATEVALLEAGAVVGEMALLFGGTRTAAVTATRPSMVLDLGADAFGRLVAAVPEVGLELTRRAAARLRESQVVGHLARVFGSIPAAILDDVRAGITYRTLDAGELLYRQGDEADGAHVVLSGRLQVVVGEDVEAAPTELGPGELVGELALLDDEPRAADVVAVRDTTLACLPRNVFDQLVTAHPTAMLGVVRRLVVHVRDPRAGRRRPDAHRSIVVVPHGDDVDVRLFTTQLVAALDRPLHVWSARIDAVLGQAGIAQAERGTVEDARLAHWLHEAEQQHPLVVHEADREWSPWTARVCRQADEVVVVARADAEPALGRLEVTLDRALPERGGARRTLVLLHGAGASLPTGTAAWLDHRPAVGRHLHVRTGSREDLERLARILSGTATSLVLGGGGARGGGHLGVLRAMRELDIPVDMIGGTSIGAAMALPVALEWPGDEAVPRMAAIFADLLDYTLPVVSLLKGERITAAITEATDDRDVEDLWVPWFCISTNLTRQAEVVHRRGDLATAVRASVAIPGVLPPVPYDGDLLVDGGSVNNLPVDHMRAANPTGTVIAVDVAPPRGPSAKSEVTPVVSGWSQIAGRVVPGRRPVRAPGIVTTILGATIVAAMRDRHQHLRGGTADLVLDLDLRGHGLLDFEAIAAIAELGYEAAMPRLAAWREDADRAGGPRAAADLA